jgi:hypothetical protein
MTNSRARKKAVRVNETGKMQQHYLKIFGEFALNQAIPLINRYFCATTGSDEFWGGLQFYKKVPGTKMLLPEGS